MARRWWAIWDLLLKSWYNADHEDDVDQSYYLHSFIKFKDKGQAMSYVEELNKDKERYEVKEYKPENS